MRGRQAVAIALCLLPGVAWAVEPILQVGYSETRQAGGASTLWGQAVFAPRSVRGVSISPVASVGWIQGRHHPDYSDDVFLAGGGARMRFLHDGKPTRFFLEGQVLGAHGRTQAISGPIQFGTAAGWSGQRVEILIRHISNAGISGANRGETMLLVGWRF